MTGKKLPESIVLYQGSNEYSGLYIDGKLEVVGDHYLSEERLQTIFGVEVVCSNDFMRGQNQSDGAARTLEEVEAYRQTREDMERRAERLRAQAAELIAEADRLSS